MEFKNYMPCPSSVSEAVIEKVKAEKAAAKK
jgi:elongation factor G